MSRFTITLKYLSFVLLVFLSGLSYSQDDPNIDNTIHLFPQPSILPNSPAGREIITSNEGFDNFYLGVDFAEPHMSANPNNPTEYFNALIQMQLIIHTTELTGFTRVLLLVFL